MIALVHNIGTKKDPNYTNKEAVYVCKELITCDGVYRSVLKNVEVLKGKKVILFVVGDLVGGDNSEINPDKPLEQFCDWREIGFLEGYLGAQIGWHSWTHRDLTKLSDKELKKELEPPGMIEKKYFAYPYGKFDVRVIQAVRDAGYKMAFSVDAGDGSDYQITRKAL